MLRAISLIFVTSSLFFSSVSLAEGDDPIQQIDSLIAENKLNEAEAAINEELKKSPNAPKVLIRKSRVISLRGDSATNEDEKVKLFEEAQSVAESIISKNPKVAGGYLRRAVSAGKLALYKGILQSRALILQVKADASKALEMETASEYEKALANYLLGRAHMKVSEKPKALRIPLGLGWASKSKGREHLEKAATLAPTSIPFVLTYAELLIEEGKKAEAKKLLESIAELKVYDPADTIHKKTAASLLTKI